MQAQLVNNHVLEITRIAQKCYICISYECKVKNVELLKFLAVHKTHCSILRMFVSRLHHLSFSYSPHLCRVQSWRKFEAEAYKGPFSGLSGKCLATNLSDVSAACLLVVSV